jgi:hypothetical protein
VLRCSPYIVTERRLSRPRGRRRRAAPERGGPALAQFVQGRLEAVQVGLQARLQARDVLSIVGDVDAATAVCGGRELGNHLGMDESSSVPDKLAVAQDTPRTLCQCRVKQGVGESEQHRRRSIYGAAPPPLSKASEATPHVSLF